MGKYQSLYRALRVDLHILLCDQIHENPICYKNTLLASQFENCQICDNIHVKEPFY